MDRKPFLDKHLPSNGGLPNNHFKSLASLVGTTFRGPLTETLCTKEVIVLTELTLQPLINALPALLGVLIGAVGTYISGRHIKSIEISNAIDQELKKQKRIFCADFICESNRLVILSFTEKMPTPTTLTLLTSYLSNIEILCNKPTIDLARKIFDHILSAHSQKENHTLNSSYYDLRTEFTKIVREEVGVGA